LKLPVGAGSQFDVSAGRSFWITIVSEPSGFFFSPSVCDADAVATEVVLDEQHVERIHRHVPERGHRRKLANVEVDEIDQLIYVMRLSGPIIANLVPEPKPTLTRM
jgi:hypothetical protein